jgi:hypothetical protein
MFYLIGCMIIDTDEKLDNLQNTLEDVLKQLEDDNYRQTP